MSVFASLDAQTCFASEILSSVVVLSTVNSDNIIGEDRDERA